MKKLFTTATVIFLLFTTHEADAQNFKRFKFGLGAGLAFPVGDEGEGRIIYVEPA